MSMLIKEEAEESFIPANLEIVPRIPDALFPIILERIFPPPAVACELPRLLKFGVADKLPVTSLAIFNILLAPSVPEVAFVNIPASPAGMIAVNALEIAPLLSPKPEDAWFTNSELK
jgi:hypothetical protein